MNTKIDTEPMKLLIDSANGIYCWQSLAQRFPLYEDKKESTLLVERAMVAAFNPDNEQWCEEIDHYEGKGIYVMHDNGEFWQIQQIEGDIWAINPKAEYSEEEDTYIIQ